MKNITKPVMVVKVPFDSQMGISQGGYKLEYTSKFMEEKLEGYIAITIPYVEDKRIGGTNGMVFESFYPKDFKEKDLSELKREVTELFKSLKPKENE